MNIETGREFSFTNPQDDPELYPPLPPGFRYTIYGKVVKRQPYLRKRTVPVQNKKSECILL